MKKKSKSFVLLGWSTLIVTRFLSTLMSRAYIWKYKKARFWLETVKTRRRRHRPVPMESLQERQFLSCFAAFFTVSFLAFRNRSTQALLQNFSCQQWKNIQLQLHTKKMHWIIWKCYFFKESKECFNMKM